MNATSPRGGAKRVAGRRAAFIALAAAGCLWGTGFLFGKIALGEMSVGHMTLYRFLFACLGLIPVAFRHRLVVPHRTDLFLFFAAAALYVPIQFLIQFEGLDRTTVAHASLMVGTLPIMLAVGAVVFTRERLSVVGWLLLMVSTAGAVLIALSAKTSSGSGASLIGDVLVFVSMAAGVGWVLVTQRLMHQERHYESEITTLYVIVLGTVMLTIIVLIGDGPLPIHLSTQAWIALAAQGLLATTLSTLLWNWGLTRVSAARAGIFTNFEPVVGSILGVVVLHESLGPMALLGGVLIIGAAVAFSQLRRE